MEISPIPNTLENALLLFPMHFSSRKRGAEEMMGDQDMKDILFPDEDKVLSMYASSCQIEPEHKVAPVVKRLKMEPVLFKNTRVPYKQHIKRSGSLKPVDALPILATRKMEPPNEFGVSMCEGYYLYDYQKECVRWMINMTQTEHDHYEPMKRGGILAMQMGLGKSLTSGTFVCHHLVKQRRLRMCSLYVCPKNLLGTIRHELDKFFGRTLRVIIYHRDFMRSKFEKFSKFDLLNVDVVITNYDSITPKSALGEVEWFTIILDESHEIRERRSQRNRNINALKSRRRFCMTGTPIHNGVGDLFSQLEFTGLRYPTNTNMISVKGLQLLHLRSHVYYLDMKDVQSVAPPTKHIHTVLFELSPRERLLHDEYLRNARRMYEMNQEPGKPKHNVQVIERCMIRSSQICSAPWIMTPSARGKSELGKLPETMEIESQWSGRLEADQWLNQRLGESGIYSSKMQRFVSLMCEMRERSPLVKVVVFANYSSTLRLSTEAMTNHLGPGYKEEHVVITGEMNNSAERDHNYTSFRTSRTVNTLYMTLKLGSVGLNLSEASVVVFLEPWYSYSALSQGEGRVHRIGQTREVHIYYMLARGSSEENMYDIAQSKRRIAEDAKADRSIQISDYSLDTSRLRNILYGSF